MKADFIKCRLLLLSLKRTITRQSLPRFLDSIVKKNGASLSSVSNSEIIVASECLSVSPAIAKYKDVNVGAVCMTGTQCK